MFLPSRSSIIALALALFSARGTFLWLERHERRVHFETPSFSPSEPE
jgi:hypothetical protein